MVSLLLYIHLVDFSEQSEIDKQHNEIIYNVIMFFFSDLKEQDVTEENEENEISPCEAIVNQIRRDEFGVGIQLSEDGQRLMKVNVKKVHIVA